MLTVEGPISIAVIGGSGLYELEGAREKDSRDLITPYGAPSARIDIIDFEGIYVAFLPRHGRGHVLSPRDIPVKANIYALKMLGVRQILSISAVGSLREEIRPEDFVLPDQIIDQTRGRSSTFFEDGIAGHIAFADPFCPEMRRILRRVFEKDMEGRTHFEGTYVCMEGPAFSTRAESRLYQSWGASVIGMTALPEAKLAREAEMSYVQIAMCTDYDCWKEAEDVSVEMIFKHMRHNTSRIKKKLPEILREMDKMEKFPFESACRHAIITHPDAISPKVKEKLGPLYGKYFEN